MVVTRPSTPLFFVTHPPKMNELDTVVTTPLSSDPDNPSKFRTCTKCHSDSSSACYFCYSQQHIISSNPHINDAHLWKEQDSHTSRNEHCVTPKQALLAPSLHWYFFLLNLVVIFTSSTTRINCFLLFRNHYFIISSHGVLLVTSMKKSELISHKNPQFKANYLLDDACFILDYYGRDN